MAKVQMLMPEEYLKKLSKLSDKTDAITEEVLKAGAAVILPKFQSNLDAVIGEGTKFDSRATGELQRSLGVSSVKLGKDGNLNIKVGFAEPRSDGESNAKLATIIEYGKHGQPAKPFLKPTKSAVKKTCEDAMIKKFDEEVKKL